MLEVVRAVAFVRKMAGGAQAHMLAADDGHYYVVKFKQNPQGHRILVNELVSSLLLSHFPILTPQARLVFVDQKFLEANPYICMSVGSERLPVAEGLHFGSQVPFSPQPVPIFDLVPQEVLTLTYNIEDLIKMLVFDKWVSNSDGRQAIFFRVKSRAGAATWMCNPIDNGMAFCGECWNFLNSAVSGMYRARYLYQHSPVLSLCEDWLERLARLHRDEVEGTIEAVPKEWFVDDERAMTHLLRALYRRRSEIRSLILATASELGAQ